MMIKGGNRRLEEVFFGHLPQEKFIGLRRKDFAAEGGKIKFF